MPRIVKLDDVKFVLVKVTFGSVSCRSDGFSICCASSDSAEKALTAIGTSCSRSDWRCAVTTISPPNASRATSSSASCANAGVATVIARIDVPISALNFIYSLPFSIPRGAGPPNIK